MHNDDNEPYENGEPLMKMPPEFVVKMAASKLRAAGDGRLADDLARLFDYYQRAWSASAAALRARKP